MFQFHALNGKNICSYQLVCDSDVNLQNKDSVIHCLQILSSFRLIMQVALPQEHLCWIIFNGIYQCSIFYFSLCLSGSYLNAKFNDDLITLWFR